MVLKSIVFYLKSGREVKLNANMDIDVEKFKSVYNSNLKDASDYFEFADVVYLIPRESVEYVCFEKKVE